MRLSPSCVPTLNKHLAKKGVDKLLSHLGEIPNALRNTIRNAGGGYVNHHIFFNSMSPNGGGEPSHDALIASIKAAFGNFGSFKSMFTLAALEVFGSGWAWLIYDPAAKALKITSTANQDTPSMTAQVSVLLGIDVWEHAYYLKHANVRKNYIEDWWQVVNWDEVGERLDAAKSMKGKSEL